MGDSGDITCSVAPVVPEPIVEYGTSLCVRNPTSGLPAQPGIVCRFLQKPHRFARVPFRGIGRKVTPKPYNPLQTGF